MKPSDLAEPSSEILSLEKELELLQDEQCLWEELLLVEGMEAEAAELSESIALMKEEQLLADLLREQETLQASSDRQEVASRLNRSIPASSGAAPSSLICTSLDCSILHGDFSFLFVRIG